MSDYRETIRRLEARIAELEALISSPLTDDFDTAVPVESAHAAERWREEDARKTSGDWYMTVSWLAYKASLSHLQGDRDKARHHVIAAAGALRNWFRAIAR